MNTYFQMKLKMLEYKNRGLSYVMCLEQEILKAWDGSTYLRNELTACMNAKEDLKKSINSLYSKRE